VLSDLFGSAAAIVAALVIMFTGWMPIDAILSVFVSLLILVYAWNLAKKTIHILIEGTPDATLPKKIEAAIKAKITGVIDVHHIHIWSLTETQIIATLDVVITPTSDQQTVLCAIQRLLLEEFKLDHVTIQIEKGPCFDL
jgi:cobalt-zinc-cadmium efflux system protein